MSLKFKDLQEGSYIFVEDAQSCTQCIGIINGSFKVKKHINCEYASGDFQYYEVIDDTQSRKNNPVSYLFNENEEINNVVLRIFSPEACAAGIFKAIEITKEDYNNAIKENDEFQKLKNKQ